MAAIGAKKYLFDSRVWVWGHRDPCNGTLERLLTKNNPNGNKWTEHDLLKNAQSMGAGTGPRKSNLWGKALKEGRIFETGAG